MSRYYRECPFCGANLDPSEICDCRDAAENGENRVKRPQARFDGREVTQPQKNQRDTRSRRFCTILEGMCDEQQA